MKNSYNVVERWTRSKMLFQVSELDLKNEVLEEQLIGVDVAFFATDNSAKRY
jgi:hypothetical protein